MAPSCSTQCDRHPQISAATSCRTKAAPWRHANPKYPHHIPHASTTPVPPRPGLALRRQAKPRSDTIAGTAHPCPSFAIVSSKQQLPDDRPVLNSEVPHNPRSQVPTRTLYSSQECVLLLQRSAGEALPGRRGVGSIGVITRLHRTLVWTK